MSSSRRIGINRELEQLRDIRYSVRDFASLVQEMNQRMALYFPEAGTDLSEGSGSQVLIELMAYATDVLHFYLDKQFNELFLDRGFEIKNMYGLAKGLGYQPSPVRPSIAPLNFQFDIPVTGSLTSLFYFNLERGTAFLTKAPARVRFENLDPIIFNAETATLYSPKVVIRNDGIVVTRLTRNDLKVISGETKTFTHYFDGAQGIKKIHIPDTALVNDVLSVFDSDGNEWYRVQNLSQEFIFTGVPSIGATDNSQVPFILTVKRVPRRFVAEFNSDGSVDLVFGTGDIDLTDTEFILSPENFVFPNRTQGKFRNFSPDTIQLNDFLNTTSLGVSPRNVSMIVKYRTGGGLEHNIAANLITKIENADLQFYSIALSNETMNFVRDSITVANPEPAQGGSDAETIEQIRHNASYHYAAQQRVVSIEDYIARVASMPPEYGSVYKIVARQAKNQSIDNINTLTDKVSKLVAQRKNLAEDEILRQEIVNLNEVLKNSASDVVLHVICRNSDGHLTKPTGNLRRNVLTYINHFKIASDTIDISDVRIINIGCRFTLNTDTRRYKPGEVLMNAAELLRSYLALETMDIGKDINLDDIRARLMRNMKGVISVPELQFVLLSGTTVDNRVYSNDFTGDISQFLRHGATILQCPPDSMFEIKYPLVDIIGRFDN